MKRFTEQLQNKASSVKLRVSEKQELRERLVSYMEYHPMPVMVRQTGDKAATESVRLIPVSFWRAFQVSGAMLGVLLLSVTYLAERAVPGDSLYSVKVSFNEELRSTLARTSYEKVVWETERLNRRISEARLLASEGRLTDEVEQEVAEAVRAHSDNAKREIEILKQTDSEEATLASIELATAIDVQSTSLKNNEFASTTDGKSTARIASVLAESQDDEAHKTQDDVLPSYTKLSAHLESETTRAYELLSNIDDLATLEEKSDLKRRLEDIERSIAEAPAAYESGDVGARLKLVNALQRTQKLIVFMANIDLRDSVTVEQIVPVTPTQEERILEVKRLANQVLDLIKASEIALNASSSSSLIISEKLLPAMAASKVEAEAVLETIKVNGFDLEAVEAKIKDAHAIADDAATLLNIDRTSLVAGEREEPAPVEVVAPVSTSTASSTETSQATTSTDGVTEIIDDLI